jgi:hypothetical protein
MVIQIAWLSMVIRIVWYLWMLLKIMPEGE